MRFVRQGCDGDRVLNVVSSNRCQKTCKVPGRLAELSGSIESVERWEEAVTEYQACGRLESLQGYEVSQKIHQSLCFTAESQW